MLVSLKQRRIAKEREAAVAQRESAAKDFATAVREAEAALETLKACNDRFYRSHLPHEQLGLSDLRRTRERMFAFHAAKEVADEAPHLSRLLGLRVTPMQTMPLIEWINHTSKLDLVASGEAATMKD